MPYRLEANETIAAGMHRLLIECVNQIIDDLTNPETERDTGVHEARKNCKRVRAAYRLIRDEIGDDLYRQENIRFRDTARLLAGARDSWVLIGTLDSLVTDHADPLNSQAFEGVRQYLQQRYEAILARESENTRVIPEIVENMRVARAQIENLPIQHADFSAFRPGIQRVYRRGRQAMQQAYTDPHPKIFHEWRKRVKYLWHQIQILEASRPKRLSKLANELHTLSDYLGDDHDLAVLRQTILEEPSGFRNENEQWMLVAWIDEARLALEAAAQPLSGRLFAEPPKRFAKRLETYWQAWRASRNDDPTDLGLPKR
jgi:CHAD domain-containing protein